MHGPCRPVIKTQPEGHGVAPHTASSSGVSHVERRRRLVDDWTKTISEAAGSASEDDWWKCKCTCHDPSTRIKVPLNEKQRAEVWPYCVCPFCGPELSPSGARQCRTRVMEARQLVQRGLHVCEDCWDYCWSDYADAADLWESYAEVASIYYRAVRATEALHQQDDDMPPSPAGQGPNPSQVPYEKRGKPTFSDVDMMSPGSPQAHSSWVDTAEQPHLSAHPPP